MNESAIDSLAALGATIKPFAVRSIGLAGLVVRFDDDQRGADGLISKQAALSLKSLAAHSPVLLELRGVRIEGGDEKRILELSGLAGLDLAGAIGGDGLGRHLSELSRLELLDLSSRQSSAVATSEAAKLPRLKRLCLNDAHLDDAAIDSLSVMPALKELFIARHGASQAAISRLQSVLPTCRIVT